MDPPLSRSRVRSHCGERSEEGRGFRLHFVALLLGIAISEGERKRMAVAPVARARSESRRVVLSGIRGQLAMTSLIRGDRSAVSIAHKVRVSFGGSIKRHEERRCCGMAKGVGHECFPIHATKNGGAPECSRAFTRSHALSGESSYASIAFRARIVGMATAV